MNRVKSNYSYVWTIVLSFKILIHCNLILSIHLHISCLWLHYIYLLVFPNSILLPILCFNSTRNIDLTHFLKNRTVLDQTQFGIIPTHFHKQIDQREFKICHPSSSQPITEFPKLTLHPSSETSQRIPEIPS